MIHKTINGGGATDSITSGIEWMAGEVGSTMGPGGRPKYFVERGRPPYVTKDGLTVARMTVPPDGMLAGAMLVLDACESANKDGGDGSTTTAVLTRDMYIAAIQEVKDGANVHDVASGMRRAADSVVEALKASAEMIDPSTPEGAARLLEVAMVSTNGDTATASAIAEAVRQVGADGPVLVRRADSPATTVEIEDGVLIDRGMNMKGFANNPARNKCVMNDPLVMVCDHRIDSVHGLTPFIMAAKAEMKPLVVICDNMGPDIAASIEREVLAGNLQMLVIDCPGDMLNRTLLAGDLATMFGAKLITSSGKGIQDFANEYKSGGEGPKRAIQRALSCMGSCRVFTAGFTSSFAEGPGGSGDAVNDLRSALRAQSVDAGQGDEGAKAEMESAKARLGRVAGKIAKLNVGGVSSSEEAERLARVDDALNAVRGAINEGVVPGAGIGLHAATVNAALFRSYDPGMAAVFQCAMHSVSRVLEANMGKPVEAGPHVIDPVKVLRCAVLSAASVASTAVTIGSVQAPSAG